VVAKYALNEEFKEEGKEPIEE
jgi:hypothetical protein